MQRRESNPLNVSRAVTRAWKPRMISLRRRTSLLEVVRVLLDARVVIALPATSTWTMCRTGTNKEIAEGLRIRSIHLSCFMDSFNPCFETSFRKFLAVPGRDDNEIETRHPPTGIDTRSGGVPSTPRRNLFHRLHGIIAVAVYTVVVYRWPIRRIRGNYSGPEYNVFCDLRNRRLSDFSSVFQSILFYSTSFNSRGINFEIL